MRKDTANRERRGYLFGIVDAYITSVLQSHTLPSTARERNIQAREDQSNARLMLSRSPHRACR